MGTKRVDRRVQRTRQLLRGALVSLIQERGFEGLTVQDIIDRANVGRATFYAHFDSKDDLLVSGLDDLRLSLRERQRRALSGGAEEDDRVFGFSREMFVHADEHRVMFRAMMGKRSGAVVQRLLHKMLMDLVRDDLKAISSARGAGSSPAEAVVQFVAGGLFGLLMWWADGRPRPTAGEMDALFRRLALPATKAALR